MMKCFLKQLLTCRRTALLWQHAGAPMWLAALFLSSMLLLIPACVADDSHPSSVPLNSYLPPEGDSNSVTLVSPNNMFNLIVQTWNDDLSSLYCMAGVINTKTGLRSMVWAANNGQPLLLSSSDSPDCRLYLSPKGDLLLQHDGNKIAWQTGTADIGVSNVTLNDFGDLLLITDQGSIAWQSFTQSPAYHFYPGMNLTSNMTILSSIRPGGSVPNNVNFPGSYGMQLDDHSRLVLFTNTNDSSSRFVYWSTSVSGASGNSGQASYITLDANGFTFRDSSSKPLGSIPSVNNIPSIFRSTIMVGFVQDDTANLMAYYRKNGSWSPFFNSSIKTCENPAKCGIFNLCNATTGNCSCPRGFDLDGHGPNCTPKTEHASAEPPCPDSADARSYEFVELNVSFYPQMSPRPANSVRDCKLLCAKECTCRAALFDPNTSSCSTFATLQAVPSREDSKQLLLLKLGMKGHSFKHLTVVLWTVVAVVAVFLCTGACAMAALRQRRKRERSRELPNEEGFLQELPRLPPRYTYEELVAATQGFALKIGEGGFGAVYEGILPSGVKVAVKKLEDGAKQSLMQFRAEVASIGSVSHVNLVTLKGFYYGIEGRLLVYEHMGMGSLDRWLFQKGDEATMLGWQRRCRIATDTAKGLTYLHHECGEKIVHCDVKPENILLDEEFNAKLGDFGLAKLVAKERQSFVMTTLKGTRGYLAPEWLQNTTITTRSDVYSFGVVLLELISGRRCLDLDYGYLPMWAFRIASSSMSGSSSAEKSQEERHEDGICNAKSFDDLTMEAFLDQCLSQDVDATPASLERMLYIGLWCLQQVPTVRPPMSVVVQMLEGVVDVPVPPLQTPPMQANCISMPTCSSSLESQPLMWTVEKEES